VLTLTSTAAETVRQLMASARASSEPHTAIRISPGVPGPTGTPLEVALADEPEATDRTIEEAGATLFVEETAAELLDDKILDASVEADGVRFTILEPREGAPGEGEQQPT
jgi:iron-sulfur cluster assembly protein